MSFSSRWLMNLVGVLAICGVGVSAVSLQRHYATSKTAYCDIGETFNCDLVNRSSYSSILGVPVALVGLLGYAALAGLVTVYRHRRTTPTLLFWSATSGLLFALYLTYIEGRVLGLWCILCLCSLCLIATITAISGFLLYDFRKGQ
jgi:uncharacterized membrane protein